MNNKVDKDTVEAIRALEEMSFLLESDAELTMSMSLDEVDRELREMGLDPDKPLADLSTGDSPPPPSRIAQIRDVMKEAINAKLQTPEFAFAGPAPDDWIKLGANADESLVALSKIDSMGNYILRLEASNREKWTNSLIQFDWKPHEDHRERFVNSQPRGTSQNDAYPLFAVLVTDNTQVLAPVASIRLSSERFEVKLPDRPFPTNRLTAEMREIVRESIARAASFHELMAWQQLASLDIDPEIRALIQEETQVRLA